MLKTISIFSLLWLSCLSLWAETQHPNLPLDQWKLDDGVVLKGDHLHFTGDEDEYLKARIDVPSTSFDGKWAYFAVELQFKKLQFGEKHWERPKVKIYNANHKSSHAFNVKKYPKNIVNFTEEFSYPELYFVKWKLPKGDNSQKVTLEIALQSTEGEMIAKNPKIYSELPKIEYPYPSFPYKIEEAPVNVIHIDSRSAEPFNAKIIGVNSPVRGSKDCSGYDDPKFDAVMGAMKPSFMRFPGGTIANWYNWRTDRWATPDPQNFWKGGGNSTMKKHLSFNWILWPTQKGHSPKFKFESFSQLTQKHNIDVTLVFNILYDSPEESAARLKHRLESGVRIKWIELGNEQDLYNQIGYGDVHSAEDYLKKCRETTAALKAVDPNVQIAINTAGDGGHFDQVMASDNFYDGVVVHFYTQARKEPDLRILDIYRLANEMHNRLLKVEEVFPDKKLLMTEYGVVQSPWQKPQTFASSIMDFDLVKCLVDSWRRGHMDAANIHSIGMSGNVRKAMGLFGVAPELEKSQTGFLFELLWQELSNAKHLKANISGPTVRSTVTPAINAIPYINSRGKLCLIANHHFPVDGFLEVKLDDQGVSHSYTHQVWQEDASMFRNEAIAYPLLHNPMKFLKTSDGKSFTLQQEPHKNTAQSRIVIPQHSISIIEFH